MLRPQPYRQLQPCPQLDPLLQHLLQREANATALFTRIVPVRQEAFAAEGIAFTTLFTLDNATVTVRAEANKLLFSALELFVHLDSPASD
ncbi:hypothetical protein CYMTET_38284 [Cymbomonas tetramitiformis]|uniref:Uncharacterized protein n=1 Tax=Cymbomonas tetramitiformis TaxID=36881 RepID=A0AAE0F5D7_9CHLO|nr:hypothetical protein CYMTET_38284 [Cymbomonas tetramitiformis]